MKKSLLFVALAALSSLVACGNGNNNGGNFPPPSGNFSNASLNGRYAYQLEGTFLSSGASFREAGTLVADGNGNITSGTDDLAIGNSIFTDTVSGTYSIGNDGTGTANLNFGSGDSIRVALTLVNTNKAYWIEYDVLGNPIGNGFGLLEKQDTTAFSAPPAGTYVFKTHSISSVQGSTSVVGAFTSTGGTVAGNQDTNRGGVLGSSTITGTLNFPSATTGRGTGTFTDSSAITTSFNYYVVNANTIIFFSTVAGSPGLGRAERQIAGPYSAASLTGSYAFGSRGDTAFGIGGVDTAGRLTADGAGSITTGVFDSVEDGVRSTNIDFTGTYAMASSGRATVTFTPSVGNQTQQVWWMVSPARAFVLTSDTTKVEDGSADQQLLTTFSNATMNGQYAFVMDGFDSSLKDRVGTLRWDGAGNLILDEASSATGVPSFATLGGTYSVATGGRATATVNGLSNNLVFYLISANDAYILQNDTNIQIQGSMSKQP